MLGSAAALTDTAYSDRANRATKKAVAEILSLQESVHDPASGSIRLARMFARTKGAGIYQGTCTQDQTANGTQNSRAKRCCSSVRCSGSGSGPSGTASGGEPAGGTAQPFLVGDSGLDLDVEVWHFFGDEGREVKEVRETVRLLFWDCLFTQSFFSQTRLRQAGPKTPLF